jgi:hypothetical protein
MDIERYSNRQACRLPGGFRFWLNRFKPNVSVAYCQIVNQSNFTLYALLLHSRLFHTKSL